MFGKALVHIEENHRYLHNGGAVAQAGEGEQSHKAGEKAPKAAALAIGGQKGEHAAHGHNHADKHNLGDGRAAFDFIGKPAAQRAHQSADQGAEKRIFHRVHRGKLAFNQKRKAGGKADKRAECAQIKHAHNPVVFAGEDNGLVFKAGFGRGDIIHAKPSRQRGNDDKRHPHKARVLQPHLLGGIAFHPGLRFAAERAEHAGGDDERHHKLHHRHTQIAQTGIKPQRRAFFRFRKEKADVGHA